MPPTSQAINDLADQVIAIDSSRGVFALRLGADITPAERALVISTHGRVLSVLRSRGHRVRANLIHDDLDGEVLTIRLQSGPSWSNAPGG